MIIGVLAILGLCFGSFVNALIWRIYQQNLPKKKRVASDPELSISRGRSICPNCQHLLGVVDLVPVISWIMLRGKCHYCRKPIAWQYPVVELLTAALFAVSYVFWPYGLGGIIDWTLLGFWLIAVVAFVSLIVYDIRWMLLPNRIVFPLTGLAVAYAVLRASQTDSLLQSLLGALGGLLIAGGIFYVLFQLSSGKWIGGGDVKLGFVLGLLLGSPMLAFLMLFTASLLGLIVSLPSLFFAKKQLSSRIPFGPFLIIATFVVQLFGQSLIEWYVRTILYI